MSIILEKPKRNNRHHRLECENFIEKHKDHWFLKPLIESDKLKVREQGLTLLTIELAWWEDLIAAIDKVVPPN